MTRSIGSWKSSIGVLVVTGVAVTAYLATSQPKELDAPRAAPEDSGSRPDLPAAVTEGGDLGSVEELTSRVMPEHDSRVAVRDQQAGESEGAPSADRAIDAIRAGIENATSLAGAIQVRKSFELEAAEFQAGFGLALETLSQEAQSNIRKVFQDSLDGLVEAAVAQQLEALAAAEERVLTGRYLTVPAGVPTDPRVYSAGREDSTVMFVPGASLGENRILVLTRTEDPRVFQAYDVVSSLLRVRDEMVRAILQRGK
jgi:hypothetical protein